ncbi:MAG: M10 family metallopeptidase [Inquilinus sp.]|uniref:M10 family metallopeptidase n=1 Tax=Inquilinus sp. TaxID=1932117 RepID=UPI003F2D3B33
MTLISNGTADVPSAGSGTGQVVRVSTTGNQNIDGLLDGYKWSGDTVTVAFPGTASVYGSGYDEAVHGFRPLTPQMVATASAAFTQVMAFTNLRITEGNAWTANIRLAHSSMPETAYAYTPYPDIKAGDAWFSGTTYDAPGRGDYAWYTFLHEIGHALGLKHPHETSPDVPVRMSSAYDFMEYSVMSYRSYAGATIAGGYPNEQYGFAQSYMMYDIAALQKLYGADYTNNAGNNVYTFSPTTGTMFIDGRSQGTPGANRILLTIWDGGGNDTYNFSNYSANLRINLTPGNASVLAPEQLVDLGDGHKASANVYNALLYNSDPRSLIENAIGGSGNDTVTGNQASNVLDGGAGYDTLTTPGSLFRYAISSDSGGTVFEGSQGRDTARNFEQFKFDDGLVVQADGNARVDDLFYFRSNRDIWNAHADPDMHYSQAGWREGRDPNAFFDTSWYLAQNPDVAAARINPLEHYHLAGWKEGRDPSAQFDTSSYLAFNPDIAAARIDPLEHYLAQGIYEGRSAKVFATTNSLSFVTLSYSGPDVILTDAAGPHRLTGIEQYKFWDGLVVQADGKALVDDLFYYDNNLDVWNAHVDPDTHYAQGGWRQGRDPNAFFDTSWYLAQNPDVAAAGVNPLEHYHLAGWKEGRDPSAQFDTSSYLAFNPDIAAARIDPLEHYLAQGIYEGRSAKVFATTNSLSFVTLSYSGSDVILTDAAGPHRLTGIEQYKFWDGLVVQADGKALVDDLFYYDDNLDVWNAHVDPDTHYAQGGWRQGRDPNAFFDTSWYLAQNPDVAAAGVNPLEHYHLTGWKQGRDPSARFDTSAYLAANPDVAAARIDPLEHYLAQGMYEGRVIPNDTLLA